MLWHYAMGYTPLPPATPGGRIRWEKYTHRGVQLLDRLEIPRKQRNSIFSPRFELRFNTSFDQVVRYCANPERDKEHYTWITTGLMESYSALFRAGYAFSFEAWEAGQLVGGGYGVHFGRYLCVDSGFNFVPNASKSSFVKMLLALREHGYEWVDLVSASPHVMRFGAQWIQRREFERWIGKAARKRGTFPDGRPVPGLPVSVRMALPFLRVGARILGRVGRDGVVRPRNSQEPGNTDSPHRTAA